MKADGGKYSEEEAAGFGERPLVMRAPGWQALALPGGGANPLSLKNPEFGLDILRTPADPRSFFASPEVYGIPPLFFPNRIDGGIFQANGRQYSFPVNEPGWGNHIHGFLHRSPWNVLRASGEGDTALLAMEYVNTPGTAMRGFFPHEFSMRITYRLTGGGLEQEVILENPNDSPLPAGIGFHTAFNVPFTQTGADRAEGCAIGLSAGKRLELDARHLPKGHYLPDSDQELDLREGSCPAGGFPISAHYAAEPLRVDGRPFHGAVLTDTVSGVSLRYEVDEAYGFWMLWNKSGRDGFICPEPQTMAVNAPNLRLADRASGFRSLEPHSRWRLASKISCR